MNKTGEYRFDASFRHFLNFVHENNELYLLQCGNEQCRPGKSFGPIARDGYHLHIILSGKGILHVHGKDFALKRGQIFVLFPGEEHYYKADDQNPWHYAWIAFDGSRSQEFLKRAGFSPDIPVQISREEPETYLQIIEAILQHHQLTLESELYRSSKLYEFLAYLIKYGSPKETGTRAIDYGSDVYVSAAADYIHSHSQVTKVSQISEYLGISDSYLTHLFKGKLHISPKQYIIRCRMKQSAQLLTSTELTIQEIALKEGYDDPLAFSRAFKAYSQESPTSYRKKFRQEARP